ncbi:polyamine ABC transporter substrate-binding protein [Maritimibacter sp. 55A14]|uniref:extracellular solute-binding protein n=1 Tax=Maritimibacter sp. 55A14 TaxID=2174844 RepID=UPI000D61E04E|nr:extracellular solute-binding protein [Maritimibacter sp. 55A14]PWE34242.1 polyamine ABC transporter substrate-binding protein [Maritimibacter sp. 55A14]
MKPLKNVTALATIMALAVPAMAADDNLLVFDWSGYEDPEFFKGYIEKHGEAPSYAFFGDDDEAFQKLYSGFRADVTHPCSQMVSKHRDAGLVEPWDTSKIPAFDNINEDFLASDIFKDDAGVWFIPIDWGATAITYRTDEVPEEEVQTLEVFKDPKYAGRISLPDNTDDVWSLAYLATGVSDWRNVTEEQFQAAADWMREVHPNVRAYWQDGAELSQLMSSGEVLISWSWNETPTTMIAEGHPVAFEREPAEGSSTWFCGYMNLKDGPGMEERAYDFINAWLEPRSAEYIVNAWGYGHSNAEAMADIPEETLEEVGLAEIDAPILAQVPMDNELRNRMQEEFEKIKAGF